MPTDEALYGSHHLASKLVDRHEGTKRETLDLHSNGEATAHEFVHLAASLWAIWSARRKVIHEGITQVRREACASRAHAQAPQKLGAPNRCVITQ